MNVTVLSVKHVHVSNTPAPTVALTHIFCGEIKGTKAQGFHSRVAVNDGDRPCAEPTGTLTCMDYQPMDECKCAFTSEGIKVFDNNNNQYIEKTTNANNPNYFFPDSWTVPEIVEVAREVYNKPDKKKGTTYCKKGFEMKDCAITAGLAVVVYTDGTNIISAFPVGKECPNL